MNSDRTIKRIFNTKRDGARSVGRLKLQWEDGVDQDMRKLGVKNWKKVALNIDDRQSFLRWPGPTRGCPANDDDTAGLHKSWLNLDNNSGQLHQVLIEILHESGYNEIQFTSRPTGVFERT